MVKVVNACMCPRPLIHQVLHGDELSIIPPLLPLSISVHSFKKKTFLGKLPFSCDSLVLPWTHNLGFQIPVAHHHQNVYLGHLSLAFPTAPIPPGPREVIRVLHLKVSGPRPRQLQQAMSNHHCLAGPLLKI